MATKKLIEVALPLEKINAASAREKAIRHGHPSTLHLWWARRPLAAARAVIWSSLVDDPSSHPELFPSEKEQNQERQRLFKILEDIVELENLNNTEVLEDAKSEIMKSTRGESIKLLDVFAGGGAIPLEAQRLGLKAIAHDLNPVSVIINKAMIDIPYRFSNCKPVNEDYRTLIEGNQALLGIKGISLDVEYYSRWMLEQARIRLDSLYPDVHVSEKKIISKKNIVAWIWARNVICSNPACNCKMPLVSSFILSKKKGNEAWAEPIVENNQIRFQIHKGKCPKEKETSKIGRTAIFKCPACGEKTTDAYVKEEGKNHRIGTQIMAIAVNGKHGREYYPVTKEQLITSDISLPKEYPRGSMPNNPRWFSPPAFGMQEYEEIFNNRQLRALTTFCNLIEEAQTKIEENAILAGYDNDHIDYEAGGTGAKAYGQAIGVYLAFLVDKLASINTSICQWEPMAQCPRQIFGRQAIPMMWDFAESNPIGSSSGSFEVLINGFMKLFKSETFDFEREHEGVADQCAAQTDCGLRNVMISTDPPYYDNIGYADLSDFFYLWLRSSIKSTFPSLFKTMMVPKTEELIATPYRHDGNKQKAKVFFEEGMLQTCKNIHKYASNDIPVTIYYAYKQNESKNEEGSSSGWETMLSAIINSGFTITGTWPMRTEMVSALKANVNVLASSIVLVCRKRRIDAPMCTMRGFVNELKKELRPALKQLQASNIAPVDLAQSAIGPGIAVFSRYRSVMEANGTTMTVRNALRIINEELDLYFNEQVGELDAISRFCIDLYTQNAFNDIRFGDADILARAKGTSVSIMVSYNIVYAKAGIVHLIDREELPKSIDIEEKCIWLLTQQLTQLMATSGIDGCAKAVYMMLGSNAERAKDLAYRLYTIAEQKKWVNEAFAYNSLVVAWPDIQSRAADMQRETPKQLDLFSMGLINTEGDN